MIECSICKVKENNLCFIAHTKAKSPTFALRNIILDAHEYVVFDFENNKQTTIEIDFIRVMRIKNEE